MDTIGKSNLLKAMSLLCKRFYIQQYFKMFARQLANNNNAVETLTYNGVEKLKILSCKDPISVDLAVKTLISGQVIALPTDTVYGLACNANDCNGLKYLYNIKTRDELQPTAICVADIKQFREYTLSDHLPDNLINSLLPGPVTIILFKSELLNSPFLNPGSAKVGVRIPNDNFIRSIAKLCNFPLALTSANLRGEPSSLSINEFRVIWDKLPVIFDGGDISDNPENRAASTIVDLSLSGYFKILRRGIAFQETENLLYKNGLAKML